MRLLVDRAPDAARMAELAGLAQKRQDLAARGARHRLYRLQAWRARGGGQKLMPLYSGEAREPRIPAALPGGILDARGPGWGGAGARRGGAQSKRRVVFIRCVGRLPRGCGRPGGRGAAAALGSVHCAAGTASSTWCRPGIQLLEVCEQLYALSGEDRYRALLVDLARRQQRAWPVSWAYTFDARYAPRSEEAEVALGVGAFLDPDSEHLRDSGGRPAQARLARFPAGQPFRRG